MTSIGKASEQLGISVDTIRYYEKIDLIPRIARSKSGRRQLDRRDLSRLQFIRRAQRMGFSLREIGMLLRFREDPQGARQQVRQLANEKLDDIESALADLRVLRDEFRLLINLCRSDSEGCPILENLEETHDR